MSGLMAINQATRNCTMLYYICREGRVGFLRILLSTFKGDLKLDEGSDHQGGDTPIEVANARGRIPIVVTLLYLGANLEKAKRITHKCIEPAVVNELKNIWSQYDNDPAAFRKTYESYDMGYPDINRLDKIGMEILKGNGEKMVGEVDKISERDITHRTSHKKATLLYLGSKYGCVALVGKLLSIPAVIEKINTQQYQDGSTPLHGAAWGGFVQIVIMLRMKGAEIVSKNNNTLCTPLTELWESSLPTPIKSQLKEVLEMDLKLLNGYKLVQTLQVQPPPPIITPPPKNPLKSFLETQISFQYLYLKRIWFIDNVIMPLSVCSCLERWYEEKKSGDLPLLYPPEEKLFSSGGWIQKSCQINFEREEVIIKNQRKRLTFCQVPKRFYYCRESKWIPFQYKVL
eukprot:TRINITY_DN13353_c0_g1_i1.p1 TRINITY_DN13353_c0_g1~~TRINITY_DN13353_c0_g1_i1.p1  ORF type:complete len:401 (+),score=90.36 TRINITY_DN13353_c0_g1_i1:772-1974(+)